jgi:hypothetical protein
MVEIDLAYTAIKFQQPDKQFKKATGQAARYGNVDIRVFIIIALCN